MYQYVKVSFVSLKRLLADFRIGYINQDPENLQQLQPDRQPLAAFGPRIKFCFLLHIQG